MNKNKTLIKSITLIGYLIYIILIYLILSSLKSIAYEKWINLAFYMVISHIFVTMISFKVTDVNLFSISNIFILGSYIFHLGQIIIKGLSKSYEYNFDVSIIVGSSIYIKSIMFSILTISMVSIGIILGNSSNKKEININHEINIKHYYSNIKKLAWIILVITFPIELYFSILKLVTSLNSGYLDVLSVETSGILSQLGRFHLIGVGLLIMGYSYNNKKANLILFIYMIYSAITMISGSRIYQIISIIILIYITINVTNSKIYISKVLALITLAFIMIVFLNTLSDIRAEGIRDITLLIDSFKDNIKNNPIYNILEEFGGTIYTVCLVIFKVPKTIMYSRGNQFITSLATILPNINGIFTEYNKNSNFVLSLNTTAIGGSYIGELYYSFQYISYIIAILMGFIIQKISNKFDHYITSHKFIKAAYLIMPLFVLILWVRGSYTALPRNIIWSIIMIYFMSKILIKDNRYRQ